MTVVGTWTGREARALRGALRLSVRSFAEHLGVGPRTVSEWERLGEARTPYPATQEILDAVLRQAGPEELARFTLLLNATAAVRSRPVPAAWDYESWADDLDRAVIALSRQDFAPASRMLDGWLARFPAGGLDDRGLYLRARSLTLLGDSRRDQGRLRGPLSAVQAYRAASRIYGELDVPRRVAQAELSLTVVTEMTGGLQPAARDYARLAGDERLGARDRARARLWIGTALSKDGQHQDAAGIITAAAREFEDLGEAEEWSVAHQKLALACRGSGDLDGAQRHIATARAGGIADTPLQKVRLSTAQAHILLSDPATRAEGTALLDATAGIAAGSGLSHQMATIESLRRQAG